VDDTSRDARLSRGATGLGPSAPRQPRSEPRRCRPNPGAAQARSMTPVISTPERLAVLESLNTHLQQDVTEIKHDVKELARIQSTLASDLATKTAQIATDLATKTASLA